MNSRTIALIEAPSDLKKNIHNIILTSLLQRLMLGQDGLITCLVTPAIN